MGYIGNEEGGGRGGREGRKGRMRRVVLYYTNQLDNACKVEFI